ncbi:hypothetical protein [Nocardiopsis lambiniae]|uniref:Chemotaxis protein n=1 Tax=Nocardiopsis lambiniae TaxID=3075539 RepID=A0ABU2M307_9ACTN|nr:hypothetical protein [Nocardiopsis sp. DSM 44743]MDT0327007.1 hypothetical protein [Nocardiopsis sp. DSM 44743]
MVDWAAAATAGATAIATAAGTGLWQDLHTRLKGWLDNLGERKAERALLRLEATRAEIEAAPEDTAVRENAEARWRERFEDFLDELEPAERDALARELLTLADAVLDKAAQTGVVAGDGGLAVGGDLTVKARDQGIAVANNQGGINIGANPPRPGAEKKA